MSDFSETWKAMSVADPDIAIRLREADGGYFMRKMFTEAAEEIERLRAESDRLGPLMLRAYAEIKQLRTERDEARRIFCEAIWLSGGLIPPAVAAGRGWDCFKEDSK